MTAPDASDWVAFAVFVIVLALGYLWHEARRAPLADPDPARTVAEAAAADPTVRALPMEDACAAICAAGLMPEIAEYLEGVR